MIRILRQSGHILWRAFMRFQDHHGPDRAAAVAYYTLLSLMPLLIFLISIGVAVVDLAAGTIEHIPLTWQA